MSHKYVVVLSGGLDSTTLLYQLITDRRTITSCVSFNYGQRHKKELDFAKATCEKLAIKHHIIDLWSSGFTEAVSISGSSLVSNTPVPKGHYAADNMKATVVPNRNMVMLSIAAAIAVAEGASLVATGVHAGDHFIYPDCRPAFIEAADAAMRIGNEGFGMLYGIYAPYLNATKEDIAYHALCFGVPLNETWSCYQGGDVHCGKCGTCVERLEAIDGAVRKYNEETPGGWSKFDSTSYEDATFWKKVTA